MLLALPLLALRTPAITVLERDLAYAPLARVEVLEGRAGWGGASAGAAAGLGAGALATAAPVRALAGTVVLMSAAPGGTPAPSWSWATARPLLGLGARVQAVAAVA